MNTTIVRVLLALALVAGIIALLIGKSISRPQTSPTVAIIPMHETKTRFFDPARGPEDVNSLPPGVYATLTSYPDNQLLPLSCSETFIRNWEALFFLRNQTNRKYTISLPHDEMIQVIDAREKSLPRPYQDDKKFLKGRLCQTAEGTQLFEYHRGIQPQFYDNYIALGEQINSFLFVSGPDQIVRHTINLTGTDRGPYFHCVPLQVTKTQQLYYQCTQVHQGDATTWWYEIDLTSGKHTLLDTCEYRYKGTPSRTCEKE